MNSIILDFLRKSLFKGDIALQEALETGVEVGDLAALSWDEYLKVTPCSDIDGKYSKSIVATYKLEHLMLYFNRVVEYRPDWLNDSQIKYCIHPSRGSLYVDKYKSSHNFLPAFPNEYIANLFIRKNKDIIYDYYRMQK